MRRLSWWLVGVLIVATSCTAAEPEEPSESTGDDPPATVSTTEAEDGGEAQVSDETFTALPGDDRAAVFAVEITNTSQTDLLYYSDIAVTWSGEGEEQTEPTNRVNYVLPGETAMIGELSEFDFAVEDMDVAVEQQRWYPVENLEKLDIDLRVDIDSQDIDPGDDEVDAAVEFTTRRDQDVYDNELYVRLVMRDSSGELLGCALTEGFVSAPSAGSHQEDVEFDGAQWLEAADTDESDIAIDWYSGFGLTEPK